MKILRPGTRLLTVLVLAAPFAAAQDAPSPPTDRRSEIERIEQRAHDLLDQIDHLDLESRERERAEKRSQRREKRADRGRGGPEDELRKGKRAKKRKGKRRAKGERGERRDREDRSRRGERRGDSFFGSERFDELDFGGRRVRDRVEGRRLGRRDRDRSRGALDEAPSFDRRSSIRELFRPRESFQDDRQRGARRFSGQDPVDGFQREGRRTDRGDRRARIEEKIEKLRSRVHDDDRRLRRRSR